MSFTPRPASSVSRPASRASGTGSALSSSLSDSKKRRRESSLGAVATDDLLKAPVVIKPYPSTLAVKPRILHPLMLLPREQLPLSMLDLAQPHGDFPSSRLFESRIKILDLEGRLGSNVLIARSETSRMVYVIEREGDDGLYVLCRLGSWVDVEKLAQRATVVCNQRLRPSKAATLAATALPAFITPQMHKESKRKRLAIDEIHSMVRKRSSTIADKEQESQLPTPTEISPEPGMPSDVGGVISAEATVTALTGTPLQSPKLQQPPVVQQTPGENSLSQPNAEAIFQSIRTQYFEALYLSKGSLAYFAKGPLSRARAAFHLDCDSTLEMNDLIDFLRSLVITTVLIDKKYRETIPGIMSKMNTHVEDSDNEESKTRKRKPKKPKLGKNGMYPSEDEHVRRWWTLTKPASHDEDGVTVAAMETKYHVSCLRRRETQLQMILILEILALEPLRRPVETVEDNQLPGMEYQVVPQEPQQDTATKKRKKTNLPVLLDVHADRLCIWQSVTLDDVKSLAESQQTFTDGDESEKSQKGNSDPLRDFCVDIIVPFFSARLPELCDSINRKLGGPTIQAPPKEKYAKPTIPTKPKPGAPLKRPSALKKDKVKTLERVLSNERMRRSVSRGPSGALALMRSASATTIPGLKREGSEPLLAMLPRAEAKPSSLKDRPVNVFSRRSSSGVVGGTEDSKAKKVALVEAELKEAILALKRPNRALAGKELVEAAEKRAVSAMPPQKKLKRPPARVSGVQVKATPANNRFMDVLAAESQQQQQQLGQFGDMMHSVLPPSSASVVPASSAPPRRFSNMLLAAGAAATNTTITNAASVMTYQVSATPTRKPTVAAVGGEEDTRSILGSSPIMARKAAPATRHLAVPRVRLGGSNNNGLGGLGDLPSSPGLTGLFETPVNRRASKDNIRTKMMVATVDDTPIKARLFPAATATANKAPVQVLGGENGGMAMGKKSDGVHQQQQHLDIYQRLGWDDDLLDDL
ncbi:DNA replication regulator SLD3-domain-containing protein [Apodospora peruviana]|uniref:DNA replication regulator SLD3-domain-containing protein n=1 Tax=Apodospora peruviana TaxID=516989 RepID=A0AAE0MF54_9PEZI|nr:DNA replication regulator SLD3-domain-containing protein [Apodospora peruviana]